MSDDKSLVARDDVDDIIELAATQKQKEADSLTLEEMQEVAAELDIDPGYVDQAVHELERRRERSALEAKRDAKAKKKRNSIVFGVTTLLLVVIGVTLSVSYSGLNRSLAIAEQKRAQVANVIQRRDATLATYAQAPGSPDKRAAIEGAENRIRVERKRYDEAASAYNEKARSFRGSLLRTFSDLPDKLPPSDEIDTW